MLSTEDLQGALYQGLLTTSLAPHASRVHLGPGSYLLLNARVAVSQQSGGGGGGGGGELPDSVLTMLSNVTALNDVFVSNGLDLSDDALAISLPVFAPSRPPALSTPFAPPAPPMEPALTPEEKDFAGRAAASSSPSLPRSSPPLQRLSPQSIFAASSAMASGGLLGPLLLGAQRFVVLSGGDGCARPSRIQEEMAHQLGWASGELNFLPHATPSSSPPPGGRMLSEALTPNTTAADGMVDEALYLRSMCGWSTSS